MALHTGNGKTRQIITATHRGRQPPRLVILHEAIRAALGPPCPPLHLLMVKLQLPHAPKPGMQERVGRSRLGCRAHGTPLAAPAAS